MTKKLLIIANNEDWNSWNDKILDLKNWAKTIDLEITIEHTKYQYIPFSYYSPTIDLYNTKLLISSETYGVETNWYNQFIASEGRGYDIVLFSINLIQWNGIGARGWRTDSQLGAVETQVGADENESLTWPDGKVYNNFLSLAKHEISHALYTITKQPDRTHEFYYAGDCYLEKIWNDLKFPLPNNYAGFESYWQLVYQAIKQYIMPNKNEGDIKIAAFARAIQNHEGWIESPASRSFRNKNPGNLKYVGQASAIGSDKQGFAIFPTYEVGFQCLCSMIKNACLGKSKVYFPTDTIQDFFKKFAPPFENDSDKYARSVANDMGVDIYYQIKQLIQ